MSHSRYETLSRIGIGGMAAVFLGRTRAPDGSTYLVALKRAHDHVRLDEKLAASMKQEARLASSLQHPNVVSVLDVEEDAGGLVLVLDYVEGCTLRSLLTNVERLGEDRPRETLRVLLDIAAGLHAAHQATDEEGRLLGLVHRDVSPSNVLVGVDGVSRISDFGIAKALFEGDDKNKTETGVLKGKSSYMAPEYVMHQHANAGSDLFSLAVITWESLAGARLFKGANELDTLERVARAEIRPLADERPELAVLDPVLARALSRVPSHRHRSVQEFAEELETVARDYDLVASHAEVSELVERAAHVELEERRSLLRSDPETIVGNIPTHEVPYAEAEGATEILEEGIDTAIMPRIEREPSHRVQRAQPTVRVRGTRRVRNRSTEKLALAAAFALLTLALLAMAVRLRSGVGLEEGTPRTSSTRAAPLDAGATTYVPMNARPVQRPPSTTTPRRGPPQPR